MKSKWRFLKEATVKKQEKLQLKKVTLRDLDPSQLEAAVGGATGDICYKTHPANSCVICHPVRGAADPR